MDDTTRELVFSRHQILFLASEAVLPERLSEMVETARARNERILYLKGDEASLLADQLGTILQRDGFDNEWELTRKGLMLESIIDVLTTEPDPKP